MLQSPTSIFPDPSFRLQTLVHGRTYLSPVHAPTAPSQPPGRAVDPAQYRGGIMYQPPCLPHFSLAIPPCDILPQYQPHVATFNGQTPVFHPGLVSSVRRPSFQGPPPPPPQAIESYSQTLFNLSHQTHHLSQALSNSIGPLSLKQSSIRPSLRPAPAASGGPAEEAAIQERVEPFSLRVMPNYFEACDGRLSGKGSVRELPLRPIGVSSQKIRHQVSQAKHLAVGDDANVPVHSYQPQHLPPLNHQQQHHLLPRLPRISTSSCQAGRDVTSTHSSSNNTDDDNNDKVPTKLLIPTCVDTPRSWKSPTRHCDDVPEVEFSFKDPNAVGVHHPSDRTLSRSSLNRYSLNPGPPSSGGGVGSPLIGRDTHSPTSSSVRQMSSSKEPGCSSSYHKHFSRGSVIQLASGQLKRVEDLRTDDFLDSCGISADLNVDMSRVTHIRMNHDTGCAIIGFAVGKKQIQVTVEAMVDHPFFVFNRGWSSCCPSKTLDRYGLPCHQLTVGDICISLTHRYPNSPGPSTSPPSPSSVSQPHLTLHRSGAGERGPSVFPSLSACPLLATVDHCSPKTSGGSGSSPAQLEETRRRTGQEVTTPPSGHSLEGRVGIRRKRRWSAPDDKARRDSSPASTSSTDRSPFKVILTSLPSVAF